MNASSLLSAAIIGVGMEGQRDDARAERLAAHHEADAVPSAA